jgi:hypothetical protein
MFCVACGVRHVPARRVTYVDLPPVVYYVPDPDRYR